MTRPSVSVCIPSFNGARYIREQIESILTSDLVGEVVVSDDGSTDDTLKVIGGFQDPRLRVVPGPRRGLIRNYEHLLTLARGDFIFLADQDDVWMPGKVEAMLAALSRADLVVSDCMVVDESLNPLSASFFAMRNSGPGLVRNFVRNTYLGCCMAFRRSLLDMALPFPPRIAMHDWWLGLIAEMSGSVVFLDEPLMKYRRHGGNASSAAESSRASRSLQLRWRVDMLLAMAGRVLRVA